MLDMGNALAMIKNRFIAFVTQLEESSPSKRNVRGSTPLGCTNIGSYFICQKQRH